MEYQRNLEKERETYKGKLADAEAKTKEAEGKRNSLIFEFEKERAKWALEKDHLHNQKTEAQELSERLEKRKEALLRENEKLKNENRNNRKFMYGAGGGNTSGYVAGAVQ